MKNNHVTQLDINLKSLSHNFNYLKSKTPPNTKTLGVIKAFAYGLEAESMGLHLEQCGMDYFGVAYVDEGIRLRNAGITKPILVLHAQIPNYALAVKYNLEPNLYSLHTVKKFLDFATKENLNNYPVHLKFNTGLNRLGINIDEIDELIELLKNQPYIKVISVFSHIAASEDLSEKDFTLQQVNLFNEITTKLKNYFPNQFMTHMTNTSGTINYPEAHFDMVRLGIGLYGFGNDPKETKKLKNVATLKSIISQIRIIKAGDSVSYNMAYTATKNERIAIIPIGHADGFSRPLGCGNGFVTINNQKAYTVGNVCMDMILVNVTNIDCNEGDTVIIFDNQETVEFFAEKCHTISYEILTAISQRIKRNIIQ